MVSARRRNRRRTEGGGLQLLARLQPLADSVRAAAGVLALMLSAAVAVALALRQSAAEAHIGGTSAPLLSWYFWLVSAVFAFTFADNVLERPDGIYIASAFIVFVLSISGLSRYLRATELRVADFRYGDAESEALWQQMRGKKVNLVPLRTAMLSTRSSASAHPSGVR